MIIHRVGVLNVSGNIVLITVGADHRTEAFEACSFILEEVRKLVPIKEKYTSEEVLFG